MDLFVSCDRIQKFDLWLGLRVQIKMIDLFKNVFSYIIRKTCIKAIEVCRGLMQDVPDQDSFWETYIKAVKKISQGWFYAIPMQFKTQEMCYKEVSVDPWSLWGVHGQYIAHEMCNEAIRNKFVLDWFVREEQIKI